MIKTKFSEFSGLTPNVVSEREVKFDALEVIRQAQATLASISLIDVLSVMKPENPLRKDILDMESQIHDITTAMGEFINTNIADAVTDTEDEVKVAPTKTPTTPKKEDKKEPKKDDKKEEKKDPKKDDKKSVKPSEDETPPKDTSTDDKSSEEA